MTFTLTPWIALVVFGVIIFIAVIIAAFSKSKESFEESKIRIFAVTLGGLSVIVVMVFYYSIVSAQQRQVEISAIQETARIADLIGVAIPNEIKDAAEYIPSFCESLMPLMVCSTEYYPDDAHNTENCSRKYMLSFKIFSMFQDVVMSRKYINLNSEAYLNHFLQYANSKQLYAQWKLCKNNFNQDTKDFGDMLFSKALCVNNQEPDEYLKIAREIIANGY